MLNKIIHYSLYNRLMILAGAILLLIGGTYIAKNLDIDVFPDLTAPTVVVMTEAHGMAPEEVEKLVTFPVETAVNGAANVRRVRSQSAMGFSLIWVEFDWETDIYVARQIVSEKLANVIDDLPDNVGSPTIAPQSSVMGEIMLVGLTADTTNLLELRTTAEWEFRPRFLSVGGVAQVTIIGGEYKQYQILADPYKMKYYNVSFDELLNACNSYNVNPSGGFINEFGNEYVIRGIVRTNNIKDLSNALIKMKGEYPIKIDDVADVQIGAAPKIGDGYINGEKGVILTITKQPNVNTIELTERIDDEVKEITKNLSDDIKVHTAIFKQADFIKRAVNNVGRALIEGGIFVVLILLLFLMNYRTTIISLLAIPLSLLVAIISLKLIGYTINTMSLGGMAIAIGSLVDDAIIDVDNVFKRLKENSVKAIKQPVLKVIYDASTEIRASIMNATFIIIVAFIPLFFLDGMEGRMLRPLGVSFIVSLFASLLVAVSVTPVLCSYLLTNDKKLVTQHKGSRFTRYLNYNYGNSLKKAFKYKKLIIISAFVIFIASLILMFTSGRSFLPQFNEGSLVITTTTLPGISIEESNSIAEQVEKKILAIDEISTISRKTGRAELDEHALSVNSSEIECPFELKDRSQENFLQELRHQLSSVSGINFSVSQPITHRIDHMLSGTKAAIAIKIFGPDLSKLYTYASTAGELIKEIEGVVDVNVEQQIEIPQIQIIPKRNLLAKYGISMNDFINYVNYALSGGKVSDVFEGTRSFDLILRYKEENRNSIEAIKNSLIDTYNGTKIPLDYVADIKSVVGPNTIGRENVQRKIVLACNVSGADLRGTVNKIKQTIDENIDMPADYSVDYGGQFESEARASKTLLIASLIAICVIFLILYQEFKDIKTSAVILLNLPLSLIGGVLAIKLSSGIISLPSIIGFITLFGIATRNGILLVSRYNALIKQGFNLKQAIQKGSMDRLNPILMTALTAALALIPLAIAGNKPGNEIQAPMAVVILGGLLSSTLLNIYIIPFVYSILMKKE